MSKRKSNKRRNRYTAEFRAEAVRLVKASGKSCAAIARDLGVPASCLSRWVAQAEVDAGRGPAGALTTEEKQELARLRRENRELRMEREILKKATAFFAKESR